MLFDRDDTSASAVECRELFDYRMMYILRHERFVISHLSVVSALHAALSVSGSTVRVRTEGSGAVTRPVSGVRSRSADPRSRLPVPRTATRSLVRSDLDSRFCVPFFVYLPAPRYPPAAGGVQVSL
jgi:hypothetical protein